MHKIKCRRIFIFSALVLIMFGSSFAWAADSTFMTASSTAGLNSSMPSGLLVALSSDISSSSLSSSVYASDNAFLAGLSLSSGSLNPSFSATTYSYAASVDSTVTSVYVYPAAADSTATITVNGSIVGSGSASQAIVLNSGSTYISILVAAQDGVTQKAYAIAITQSASPGYLSSLSISNGTLSPTFSQTTTTYTADVSTSSITVTAIPASSSSTVTVQGQTVAYGYASQSISLSEGVNQIYIQVTPSSGSSMTYYINVTRSGNSFTVTTNSATNITSSSVTLNGTISSGDSIDSYGFTYSTDQSAWTTLTKGSSAYTGSYSYNLTGLKANTTYYYRAYVYDQSTYTYGSTLNFKTLTGDSVLQAPSISPNGGVYSSGQTVTITTSSGNIYYTTDGSDPTNSANRKKYTAPFTVSSSTIVKAAVYNIDSDKWSTVATASYTIGGNISKNTSSFLDVPTSHWAYSTINSLKSQGYITGYADSTFHPEESISRAEITSILVNVLKISSYDSSSQHFSDVIPGDWYFAAIEKAYQKGIVSGQGSYFYPKRNISREELAAILVNAFGKRNEAEASMNEKTNFNDDSKISSWARGYVVTAVKYGFISGYPATNTFEPKSGATRAESCSMISSFLSKYHS